MTVVEILFWAALGLLFFTHIGYPLLWALLSRLSHGAAPPGLDGELPMVSLIIACHNEEEVIERKIENSLGLDYPRDRLEVLVASDGSTDRTVEIATGIAGRERNVSVLDMQRAGKVRTQDRAVKRSLGDIVVFSDANSFWEREALLELTANFADPEVGYVCGRVSFETPSGDNQEGLYWRYEMALREAESNLSSVTAGNGAIYATKRNSYIEVDPRMGHDLSFPFNMVKRGWKAKFAPNARAAEKMVPTVAGEFKRKRRMMSHAWLILLRGGFLDPRGYPPLYAVQIFSHRILRYLSPFLHLLLLATSLALVLAGAGTVYQVALIAQLLFLLLAGMQPLTGGRLRLLALPYYYLVVTASIAFGLWDWLRQGTKPHWEKAPGTR